MRGCSRSTWCERIPVLNDESRGGRDGDGRWLWMSDTARAGGGRRRLAGRSGWKRQSTRLSMDLHTTREGERTGRAEKCSNLLSFYKLPCTGSAFLRQDSSWRSQYVHREG